MNSKKAAPQVFISYSHDNEEHKDWVLQLATRLRSNWVDVILDRWNLSLWSDIASFMEKWLSDANRIICICSENYVNKANEGKGWSGYEKSIITGELVKDQNTNWVIPLIKNNDSENKVPRFLSSRMYISFQEPKMYDTKYEELLRDILDEKILPIPPIGENPFQTIKNFSQQKFIPSSEKYVSPATKGVVTFDYSNNNGRYFIWQGELAFECMFTEASNQSIHIYSDGSSIRGVALAKKITDFREIKDARIFDYSSRARTPNLNEIAIYQNENWFYAAIKILDIKVDGRNSENDEVTFEYLIQTNWSPDFSK